MRWFLSRRVPPFTRILVVESGPREILHKLIPRLRSVFGEDVAIDLLTCLPDAPLDLLAGARSQRPNVWQVADYPDGRARWRLLREIRAQRHPAAAVFCAGSPIMASWRTAALALFPAKFLIVNENADFFWLDRGNWTVLVKFVLYRSGVLEESAVRAIARLAAFPFTLVFLIAYALWVHTARGVRLVLKQRFSSL